jgi:GT2 family glycosyltransferase
MEETSNKIASVIIVTCGQRDCLRECISSIQKQTYASLEVIVMANGASPQTYRDMAIEYPAVTFCASSENVLYCEALNRGIRMSKGDFILCLNDDVVLDEKYVAEALEGFSAHPRVGMVSGKILRSDGRTIDSTGLFLSLCRTAKERGYGQADSGQFEKEEFVFGVTGAVAFYRRDMLQEGALGSDFFDTDYRIFYEDLDVAWRSRRFGWRARYIPSAIAYHVRGATVRSHEGVGKPYARRYLSDALHADLIKNRYLTLIKNESLLGFLLHLPWIVSYDVLAWGYIVFFRPRLLKSVFQSLKCLASAFRKRKLINKKVTVRSLAKGLMPKSP